jgi:hypothetical protein
MIKEIVNCAMITQINEPHLSYTGVVIHKGEGYWVFSTYYEGKPVIWECHPDYWILKEGIKVFKHDKFKIQ